MPQLPDVAARRSPARVWFFGRVMMRSMRRGFHAVRLARPGLPQLPADRPVIIYLNHPSWWDPVFIAVLARRCFARRKSFGPIDAAQLERYGFMARIGLFGVASGTRRSAATFLRTGLAILSDPRALLWITAEGAFTDARRRPVRLRPGLAHLVGRVPDAVVVPLAVEYPFWDERTPEALGRFGEAVDAGDLAGQGVEAIGALLARRLEITMDALAEDAASRDPRRFLRVLSGRVGVGGVYDVWRRCRAWASGRDFQPGHGAAEP